MRTVTEIYEAYRIPPWLQMHQLRVAAVGSVIADCIAAADRTPVVLCGLFHDMANILKIDLTPEGNLAVDVPPHERAHLQRLKDEYRAQYGEDEHAAALRIGTKIGLPPGVIAMIDTMRFLRSEWVLHEGPIEMKIAKYSDLRVSPFGIVSMQERFDEAARRYRNRGFDTDAQEPASIRARMETACRELEVVVMAEAGMRPEDITDERATPIIETLRSYQI